MSGRQTKNADLQAVNEFARIKDELRKHDVDPSNLERLLRLLNNVSKLKYDPKKIVAELSRLSLDQFLDLLLYTFANLIKIKYYPSDKARL